MSKSEARTDPSSVEAILVAEESPIDIALQYIYEVIKFLRPGLDDVVIKIDNEGNGWSLEVKDEAEDDIVSVVNPTLTASIMEAVNLLHAQTKDMDKKLDAINGLRDKLVVLMGI